MKKLKVSIVWSLLLCVVMAGIGCRMFRAESDVGLLVVGCGFCNLTEFPIKDVELKLLETGGLVSCSYIAEKGYFGALVPKRVHKETPEVVSWTLKGRCLSAEPFVAAIPDPLPEEPVVGVVYFNADGTSVFRFVPLPPAASNV